LVRSTEGDRDALVPILRGMAPFIPLAAAAAVVLAGTRGFGRMVPTALIDNIAQPAARPILALGVIGLGLSGTALALSWAGPIAVSLAASAVVLVGLVRRVDQAGVSAGPARPAGELAAEFWRFSAPRGFSAMVGITIFWLDTLL